jgi:hypothetical protein
MIPLTDLSEAELDITPEFAGFSSGDVAFSSLTSAGQPLLCSAVVEIITPPEMFMEKLQVRVKVENIYAQAALQDLETQCFIQFEKMAEHGTQKFKKLLYNDILMLKLKEAKTGGWAFSTNDKTFLPGKLTKLAVGTKAEIVFNPGFYYSETHCGLYLTLKNLNFQKAVKVIKR